MTLHHNDGYLGFGPPPHPVPPHIFHCSSIHPVEFNKVAPVLGVAASLALIVGFVRCDTCEVNNL
jgi:hypothetical protein